MLTAPLNLCRVCSGSCWHHTRWLRRKTSQPRGKVAPFSSPAVADWQFAASYGCRAKASSYEHCMLPQSESPVLPSTNILARIIVADIVAGIGRLPDCWTQLCHSRTSDQLWTFRDADSASVQLPVVPCMSTPSSLSTDYGGPVGFLVTWLLRMLRRSSDF